MVLCALLLALPVAANGRSGVGLEEMDMEHFRQSLVKLWGKLTKRNPTELASALAVAFSTQHISRYLMDFPFVTTLASVLCFSLAVRI